jgi:hypothetical protein
MRNEMRTITRLLGALGLAIALLGCGPSGSPGATGAGGTVPGGNGAGTFCAAALRLELADASNRASIQAGLEAATPAGLEEDVAVIREFMERQAAGDDPYKDPDFLFEYNNAVGDLWEHCGRG